MAKKTPQQPPTPGDKTPAAEPECYSQCSMCPIKMGTTFLKDGKTPRLPRGWKHDTKNNVVCASCLQTKYMTRSIVFPVAGVIGDPWKEFSQQLTFAWQHTTALANWAMRRLMLNAPVRMPDMKKMPKVGDIYIYGDFKNYPQRVVWDGAANSANAVIHSVEQAYKAAFRDIIWLGSAKPMHFKYPVPYPVPVRQWTAFWHAEKGGGQPAVEIPLLNDRIFKVRLQTGPKFRRQREVFSRIMDETYIPGEMEIYRQRVNEESHRKGTAVKPQGDNRQRQSYRTMVKIVVRIPKPKVDLDPELTMNVSTDPECFIVAEVTGRPAWRLNNDHLLRMRQEVNRHGENLKGWYASYEAWRQRLSEDMKPEKRYPAAQREQMHHALSKRTQKQHDRLDSALKMSVSAIVKFAARNRVATIIFDDSCRSYFGDFAWYDLRSKLKLKCDEYSIQYDYVGPGERAAAEAESVQNPEAENETAGAQSGKE